MEANRATTNELAQMCAHSADAAEWEELLRRSTPLIGLVVLHVSRMWLKAASPALVDDIAQEVFLKLCEQERRILRTFQPRGEDSFLALLRTVTVSVANDYFRRLYSAKRGGKVVTGSLAEDSHTDLVESLRQPQEMQQAVLLAQLDSRMRKAPESVSERDRILFWLYYQQGFTAGEIAQVTDSGLTAKGVESALRRVTDWVREEIEKQRTSQGNGSLAQSETLRKENESGIR
jgi:RNA polymerase sigma-70 factor (ECF subfamily)